MASQIRRVEGARAAPVPVSPRQGAVERLATALLTQLGEKMKEAQLEPTYLAPLRLSSGLSTPTAAAVEQAAARVLTRRGAEATSRAPAGEAGAVEPSPQQTALRSAATATAAQLVKAETPSAGFQFLRGLLMVLTLGSVRLKHETPVSDWLENKVRTSPSVPTPLTPAFFADCVTLKALQQALQQQKQTAVVKRLNTQLQGFLDSVKEKLGAASDKKSLAGREKVLAEALIGELEGQETPEVEHVLETLVQAQLQEWIRNVPHRLQDAVAGTIDVKEFCEDVQLLQELKKARPDWSAQIDRAFHALPTTLELAMVDSLRHCPSKELHTRLASLQAIGESLQLGKDVLRNALSTVFELKTDYFLSVLSNVGERRAALSELNSLYRLAEPVLADRLASLIETLDKSVREWAEKLRHPLDGELDRFQLPWASQTLGQTVRQEAQRQMAEFMRGPSDAAAPSAAQVFVQIAHKMVAPDAALPFPHPSSPREILKLLSVLSELARPETFGDLAQTIQRGGETWQVNQSRKDLSRIQQRLNAALSDLLKDRRAPVTIWSEGPLIGLQILQEAWNVGLIQPNQLTALLAPGIQSPPTSDALEALTGEVGSLFKVLVAMTNPSQVLPTLGSLARGSSPAGPALVQFFPRQMESFIALAFEQVHSPSELEAALQGYTSLFGAAPRSQMADLGIGHALEQALAGATSPQDREDLKRLVRVSDIAEIQDLPPGAAVFLKPFPPGLDPKNALQRQQLAEQALKASDKTALLHALNLRLMESRPLDDVEGLQNLLWRLFRTPDDRRCTPALFTEQDQLTPLGQQFLRQVEQTGQRPELMVPGLFSQITAEEAPQIAKLIRLTQQGLLEGLSRSPPASTAEIQGRVELLPPDTLKELLEANPGLEFRPDVSQALVAHLKRVQTPSSAEVEASRRKIKAKRPQRRTIQLDEEPQTVPQAKAPPADKKSAAQAKTVLKRAAATAAREQAATQQASEAAATRAEALRRANAQIQLDALLEQSPWRESLVNNLSALKNSLTPAPQKGKGERASLVKELNKQLEPLEGARIEGARIERDLQDFVGKLRELSDGLSSALATLMQAESLEAQGTIDQGTINNVSAIQARLQALLPPPRS